MSARQAGNGDGYFDLDAAIAAVEADSEPFRFTYKGQKYELPPQDAWQVDVLAQLAVGELHAALAALLGAETWERLRRDGFTIGAMNALFEEAARRSGIGGLPNSLTPPRPGSPRT